MARKKKSEPKKEEVEVVEEQPQEVVEEVDGNKPSTDDETLIPTLFIDDTPTIAPSNIDECTITTTEAREHNLSIPIECANSMLKARQQIDKCNMYIWAGLDWGVGRVYEMARKEWAAYYLALDDWQKSNYKGNIPEEPSEVVDV